MHLLLHRETLHTGLKDQTDLVLLCCPDLILNTPLVPQASWLFLQHLRAFAQAIASTLHASPSAADMSWITLSLPLSRCSNVTLSTETALLSLFCYNTDHLLSYC